MEALQQKILNLTSKFMHLQEVVSNIHVRDARSSSVSQQHIAVAFPGNCENIRPPAGLLGYVQTCRSHSL
ncbi:hypothetical protein Smp_152920 [Schistosoma mansoni]|uniref:Syntaxin-5 n=1 Tax=Schistosoma mansoni TaxID=6183 RepID=G4VMW7_SCHMA|nr:hypothetical protein Smp_152920 [Schistosoma mansoni]|eukprot:XP_018653602.1 hypothetical protein Smp_152920 [Schistosoma mansoni]